MNIINKIVNLLFSFVGDAVAMPESDIRQLSESQGIQFRDDHIRFLHRFCSINGERLEIFRQYGGDFDFNSLKSFYLDENFEVDVPPDTVFFGSDFVGNCFCIENESGKIVVFESEVKYGLVHETIDGFLLDCLVTSYKDSAFATKISKPHIGLEYVNNFRLTNLGRKIPGSTRFKIEYQDIDSPEVLVEYYLIDDQLVVVYPTSGSLFTLTGGILEGL